MLASRDRVDASRLVEVTHLDPEGADAIRERRHDSAVAETAAAFRGAGIPVVAGWRWVVLSKINSLVAEADRIAKRRLGKTDLTDGGAPVPATCEGHYHLWRGGATRGC